MKSRGFRWSRCQPALLAFVLMIPTWMNLRSSGWSWPAMGIFDGVPLVAGKGQKERAGRVIFLWHPMKTGGTSICLLSVKAGEFTDEYRAQFNTPDKNSNCKFVNSEMEVMRNDTTIAPSLLAKTSCEQSWATWKGPIQQPGIQALQTVLGRGLVAFEPSYPPGGCWNAYDPQAMLRLDSKTSAEFWDGFYHVITMRHPVDRLYSFYNHYELHKSCTGNADAVLLGVFNSKCEAFCPTQTCIRLIGNANNYYVKHLSGSFDDMSTAVYNLLYRIDLVMDITAYSDESMYLANSILGWPLADLPHRRKSMQVASQYRDYNPDAYDLFTELMALDMELYDLAIEKLRRHYQSRNGESYQPWVDSDEKQATRRKELWSKWTSHNFE